MSTSRELPSPDTHCFDEDTKRDVWSYSPELVRTMLEAATADAARKCVELCEAQRHFLIVGEPTSDDAAAAIRSAFPAAFNQEQSK